MRKIIDDTFEKAAAAVAQLAAQKPDAVIGVTAVDVPEAFFAALRASGTSFAGVTFCVACELLGENAQGMQAERLQTLLFDALQPKQVLQPTMEDYDAAIRAAGGLDLVILGLGERGHIAYNEPGCDFGAGTHENKLADVTRKALAGAFGDLEHTPTHGVTMGISTILAARRVMLLASGADKAKPAQKTLEGRPENYIPASFLQLHTDVDVYLDTDAASELG